MRSKKLAGFAFCLEEHQGEVIADFQQFYGIALPLEGEPPDLERMALLWGQLPAESRIARIQNPALRWGVTDYLLRRIENELAGLIWGLADEKKRDPEPPKPVQSPTEAEEARRHARRAIDNKARITRILGLEGLVDG